MQRYTYTPGHHYNIAPGKQAPVRRASGEWLARWGLTQPWRGHGGKRGPIVPVVERGAIALPFLRDLLAKSRCLALADGYIEWFSHRDWRPVRAKGGARWVHGEPVGLAALWGERDDGIPSFAVIVDNGRPLTAGEAWLADGGLASLQPPAWSPIAIGSYIDDPDHDDPACVTPLAQGSLF